jgi:hypothetical protein
VSLETPADVVKISLAFCMREMVTSFNEASTKLFGCAKSTLRSKRSCIIAASGEMRAAAFSGGHSGAYRIAQDRMHFIPMISPQLQHEACNQFIPERTHIPFPGP